MTSKNLYSRKNVNYKKWFGLKEVLRKINSKTPIKLNAYIVRDNELIPIFDLSKKDLGSDNLAVITNNNQFYISDKKKFVPVFPKKRGFVFGYKNQIFEEKNLFLHYIQLTNSMSKIYNFFKKQANDINDLIPFSVDEEKIRKNFEKDLGEYVNVRYNPEFGFVFELTDPKNLVKTIEKYSKDYIKILKQKFPDINSNYLIEINYLIKGNIGDE